MVFNGTHWKGFICLLECLAAEGRWTDEDKVSKLRKSLKGPASDFFSTLPQSVRSDYKLLKDRFQQHYDPSDLPLVTRWEALGARQRGDETLYEFKMRVDELVMRAYENPDDSIGVEIFLKGLPDQDMAFMAFQQKPKTLNEAYQSVKSMSALRKGLGAARRTTRSMYAEDSVEEDSKVLRAVREMTTAMSAAIQQASGQWESRKQPLQRTSPNRGCFNCGHPGHFKSNCPSPNRLCYNCGASNHLKKDCKSPAKGCYGCGNMSHYIRDCPHQTTYQQDNRHRNLSPRANYPSQYSRVEPTKSPPRQTGSNSPSRMQNTSYRNHQAGGLGSPSVSPKSLNQ